MSNEHHKGEPLALPLNDVLGQLPEPGDAIRAELPDEVAVRRVQLWAAELVAAERERCKTRAVQIVEWHRNDYNCQQIDPIVAGLKNGM